MLFEMPGALILCDFSDRAKKLNHNRAKCPTSMEMKYVKQPIST